LFTTHNSKASPPKKVLKEIKTDCLTGGVEGECNKGIVEQQEDGVMRPDLKVIPNE